VSLTIRPYTEDDVEAVHRLAQRAFSPTPGDEFDPERPSMEDDRRIVAVWDGRVVGHLGAWQLGHFLGGRRLATAGVTNVTVESESRGRGVGGALLRAGLDAAHGRGEPLATLFPLTRHVYRRKGFELAGVWPQAQVRTAALAALPAPRDVEVHPGGAEDVAEMLALERSVAPTEAGMLDRPTTFAARNLRPGPHDAVVLARRGGELVGHLVYSHERSSADHAFFGLRVKELVGRDADALLALYHVLGSSASGAPSVTLPVGPEDPLELWLPEQAWTASAVSWRWMCRLVDPAAAVAGRGWPPHVSGRAELDLVDPVWDDRGGPWTLEIEDGEAQLERGGAGTVRVEVGPLASWFTGWASATRLARYGKLAGADADTLAFLDAAAAGPAPWVRSFF
jgi:predicted acetyltransferase